MGTEIDDDTSTKHHSISSSTQKEDEGKPLPKKLKYLTAAVIFYGNIAFGCAFNSYGPSVTSLQHKYDTDDETISKVFTVLTSCNMVGALSAGIIFNYVNRQMAVTVIISLMALIMFLTPHCPTLTTYFISAGIMGLTAGSYDTAQFVWMMEMMQKDCPPYVQAQHFFFAAGTSLSGLIIAPFLDEDDEDATTTTTTSASETNDSKLFIPYSIIGAMVAITAAAHMLLLIFMRYYPPPPEKLENSEKQLELESRSEKTKSGFKVGSWSLAKLRMVIIVASFYAAYVGMEMSTMQFLPKFAQNSDLDLSESKSAYMLTGMTAAYAVGRAIAIFAVFKISTQLILCGNLVLLIVANVILSFWASSNLSMLWAASILFGFGFSSVYASISAYVERYLEFTNFIVGLVIVSGTGVAAIYPLVIGKFIEDHPIVISYTSFFSIAVMLLSFGTVSFLTHRNKTRY